jgi:hypothetical protein
MHDNHKNSLTTLNEYMTSLYQSNAKYITLSTAAITKIPENVKLYEKPLDSVGYYLPDMKFKLNDSVITAHGNEVYPFVKETSVIVVFKDSVLFVFK